MIRLQIGIALACGVATVSGATGAPDEWQPFADQDVIEIITEDPDGDLRETKIWIVVLDGNGYIRTNNSRWLANIRRGSAVSLRSDEWESRVTAAEIDNVELDQQVESAFKAKYGFMQQLMSFFRISDPTLLKLSLAGPAGSQ
ncbi:MAG: DUF2255 family protein [Myxococcota bacterium]|nr:DUF2255 family protein [Myxococcota bacterium]